MPKQNLKAFTMIPLDNEEFYLKNEKLNILHLYIMERVRGFENNNLPCYISNDQFAKETNCSPSTIKRAIKLLIESKLLWGSYHQENVKNKQRILRIYNDKIQNDPLTGSICPPERANMTPSDGQNDPLVSNKKENNKSLKDNTKRENEEPPKRKISDLSTIEACEIIHGIKQRKSYVELAKKFNLEFGSITKNFEKEWDKIVADRTVRARQILQENRFEQESDLSYDLLWSAEAANREEEPDDGIWDDGMQDLFLEDDDQSLSCTIETEAIKILREQAAKKAARKADPYNWEFE